MQLTHGREVANFPVAVGADKSEDEILFFVFPYKFNAEVRTRIVFWLARTGRLGGMGRTISLHENLIIREV